MDKYQTIIERKKNNPQLSIAQLCREQGVNYQSYNAWVKRHRQAVESLGHKIRVTVLISVEEAAELILKGVDTIPVPLANVVRGMPVEQRRKVAEALGNRHLDGIVEQQADNGSSGGNA